MSTQSLSLGRQLPHVRVWRHGKILVPSLSDLFFLSVLWWTFFAGKNGWMSLLMDASTAIQIRAGDYILATHQVPRHDLFSYTLPGRPWYAFEWLSELSFGAVHSMWGLKGVVILAGVVLAATLTLLFWSMLARGVNAWIAILLALLAVNASNIEFHARPHVFTFLMLAITAQLVEADRRRPGKAVWMLVPLTILWTNLHGGFFILFPFLGLLVAGSALEALFCGVRKEQEGWERRFSRAVRYSTLLVACGLASLVNPYGIGLHRNVLFTVTAPWISTFVAEFKSPSFHSEMLLCYMVVLFLALGVGGLLLLRRRLTEVLWIAFFGYCSLMAVRHVPLFLIVATPIAAEELSAWWSGWVAGLPKHAAARILDDIGTGFGSNGRHVSVWLPAATIALFLTCGTWPKDFPDELFPTGIVARQANLIAGSRIYTSDQWADYLIYKNYPRQRVFMDDRHQFYGAEIGKDYLALDNGAARWRQILDRYRVETVLSKIGSPLASILRERPDWRVVDEDRLAVLFARRSGAGAARQD